jgi:hypothetical protein
MRLLRLIPHMQATAATFDVDVCTNAESADVAHDSLPSLLPPLPPRSWVCRARARSLSLSPSVDTAA